MARRGNEKIRILAVARILESGKAVSRAEIEEALSLRYDIQVDRKTLYDDISVIDKIFPIEIHRRGRLSYYQRVDVLKMTEEGEMTMSDQNAKCPYNEGVVCAPIDWRGRAVERNCDACGWNPEVAKARMEKRLAAAKTEKNNQNS